MTDSVQISRFLKSYRYSIKELLELASFALLPFDLSKFSYDAARAGVVPPLGDCAMSSRRSSANRQRGWSVETTSTSDDLVVYQGNRVQQPQRQPCNPPAGELVQKDEGFAKFLRTHSSPTHQRVTAGGRIVPMEGRAAPPQFILSSQDCKESTASPMEQDSLAKTDLAQMVQFTSQKMLAGPNMKQIPISSHPTSAAIIPHVSGDFMPFSGFTFSPHPFGQHMSLDNIHNTNIISPTAIPELISMQPPSYLQATVSPAIPLYNTYNGHTPASALPTPATWPYSDQYTGMPPWEFGQMSTQDLISQHVSTTQHSLTYWEQRYDEVDQQLKDLDRHRAMSSLDPALITQRRVIVQQRSDIKDMVNNLKTVLGVDNQHESPQTILTTNLNVEAPAYIPAAKKTEKSALQPCFNIFEQGTGKTASQDQAPKNCTRRAIPIVRPPNIDTNITKCLPINHSHLKAPVAIMVDEWGLKRGAAPPVLRHQQSTLSERMVAPASQSPTSNEGSSSGSIESLVRQGRPSLPFGQRRQDDQAVAAQEATNDGWVAVTPGRAPVGVEAAYERQLDAMRQPKGTKTTVMLPNGAFLEIEGQALQRPSSAGMSKFEKDYWRRNPSASQSAVRNSMFDVTPPQKGLIDVSPCSRQTTPVHGIIGKENVTYMPIGHQKAATDAFLAQFNKIEDNELQTAKYETQSLGASVSDDLSRTRHILGEIYGNVEPHSQQSSLNLNRYEGYRRLSNVWDGRARTPVTSNESATLQNFDRGAETSPEVMGTKSYSSVAVQNVHAIGQLPQHLDGSTDSGRGTRSVLALTKATSPRLVHRSTANGAAWYGPYSRMVIERALAGDKMEVQQQRTTK